MLSAFVLFSAGLSCLYSWTWVSGLQVPPASVPPDWFMINLFVLSPFFLFGGPSVWRF